MDVKAIADWVAANSTSLMYALGVFAVVALLMSSNLLKRAVKGFEDALFTNWRLVVLGTTGVILSLVAGYTTFDGLRNFTGGGTLSLAATFGIQGVGLVTAWLIGESFASGMSHVAPGRSGSSGFSRGAQAWMGGGIGILLFVALLVLFMQSTGQVDVRNPGTGVSWSRIADKLLIVVVGLLVAGLVAVNAASDLVKPYLQGARVMIKNSILWVMFLACMSVSVFFSFDSHFSGIFPQSERVRAAELRAQNQVSGILADIGTTISKGQLSETEALFQSAGWAAYEKHLVDLAKASQGAEREIEAYFVQQMEARRQAIAQQQERIATAQSGQAGLVSKKATLTDELSRLKAERPGLAADLSEKKSELDNRSKAIDAKRVEAMAEDKGVEGSGKAGKGPVYRQRVEELGKMQEYVKIQDDRVKDAQKRLTAADTRIAQLERELAAVDGDIAKLKGEAQTAESRIKMAEETKTGEEGPKVDPARVRSAFEKARAEFRQEPTVEKLAALHGQCTQLYSAMAATPATKDKVRAIDCDPKQAAEAAAPVFALNAGIKTFEQQCAGGDKLNQHKSTDALFGFARKCLADSGLASKDTDTLRTKINFIELNRDDKAHRFVVTWNAFLDGNRLAYLALAIAITIDSLIFMSGLFGANAVRSPLSDVPSHKARSAKDLESIVESALLPEKFEAAHAVLEAMQPITPMNGFTQEIFVPGHATHERNMVLKVLNAAALIGAVERDEMDPQRYYVRGELFEFLSIVSKREFEKDQERVKLAELRKVVTVALQPRVSEHAEAVLGYCHPINEKNGFSSEIYLNRVEPADMAVVRKTLNAASTLNYVQQDDRADQAGRYYVHKQLYRTLALIAATVPKGGDPRLALPNMAGEHARPPLAGGDLTERQGQIAGPPATKALPRAERREPQQRPALQQQQQQPEAPYVPQAAAGDTVNYMEALRYDLREQLIMAMGLYPTAYNDLARNRVIGAASGAAHALGSLSIRAPTLAAQVDKELAEYREGLDDGYHRLRSESDGNPKYLEVLDSTYGEVFQLLPVLMLMPNGPYERILRELIDALEPAAGEGRASPAEAALLDRLLRHSADLKRIDRTSADGWYRLADLLNKVDGQVPAAQIMRDDEERRPS